MKYCDVMLFKALNKSIWIVTIPLYKTLYVGSSIAYMYISVIPNINLSNSILINFLKIDIVICENNQGPCKIDDGNSAIIK